MLLILVSSCARVCSLCVCAFGTGRAGRWGKGRSGPQEMTEGMMSKAQITRNVQESPRTDLLTCLLTLSLTRRALLIYLLDSRALLCLSLSLSSSTSLSLSLSRSVSLSLSLYILSLLSLLSLSLSLSLCLSSLALSTLTYPHLVSPTLDCAHAYLPENEKETRKRHNTYHQSKHMRAKSNKSQVRSEKSENVIKPF